MKKILDSSEKLPDSEVLPHPQRFWKSASTSGLSMKDQSEDDNTNSGRSDSSFEETTSEERSSQPESQKRVRGPFQQVMKKISPRYSLSKSGVKKATSGIKQGSGIVKSKVGNAYENLSSKVEERLSSDTLFGWLLDGKYVGSKSSPVGGKGIILFIGVAAAVLMAAAQWLTMREEYETANILQISAYCCWVLYFLFNILKGTPSLQIECSLTMKMLACLNVLIFAVFNRISGPPPEEMPKTLLLAASLTFLVSTLYSPKNHMESFALSGTLLLLSSAFAAVMEKGGDKSYDLTSNVVAMIYLAISCWAAFKVEQKGGEVWISYLVTKERKDRKLKEEEEANKERSRQEFLDLQEKVLKELKQEDTDRKEREKRERIEQELQESEYQRREKLREARWKKQREEEAKGNIQELSNRRIRI